MSLVLASRGRVSSASACSRPTWLHRWTVLLSLSPSEALRRKMSHAVIYPSTGRFFGITPTEREFQGSSPYRDAKKARKERRWQLWKAREEAAERRKVRRQNRPDRGMRRRLFDEWFLKKKTWNEIQNRLAKKAGKPFQIHVTTLIERAPTVMKEKPEWEKQWIELENHLQFYKQRFPDDFGVSLERLPEDEEAFIDLLPEEMKPVPRETEHDKSGNIATPDRRLDDRVYYCIPTETDKSLWQLPSTPLEPGETLLEAAKRSIPTGLDCWYPSNMPWAVDITNVKNPPTPDHFGIKTFIMKLQRVSGDATDGSGDHAWLSRDEVVQHMLERHGKNTSRFYHYML